jgi:hypothetical protein
VARGSVRVSRGVVRVRDDDVDGDAVEIEARVRGATVRPGRVVGGGDAALERRVEVTDRRRALFHQSLSAVNTFCR